MSRLAKLLALAVASCAFLLPGSAGAATVVNGGFESGFLTGWTSYSAFNNGVWNTYSGTGSKRHQEQEQEVKADGKDPAEFGLAPFFLPPEGVYGALNEQNSPDTSILFQDVTLEPRWAHQLAASVYYRSQDPIAVPTPDTLETEGGGGVVVIMAAPGEPGFENQQMRFDVIKPTAPIATLDPADILATLFATKPGDPLAVPPTAVSADLTPFAGQTVRLRIATAINEGPMEAAVDAVSISSTPPSNKFQLGKLKLFPKKSSAKLAVKVPGPGVVKAVDAAKKGKPKFLKATKVKAKKAGTVQLPLKPNGLGLREIEQGGSLEEKATITFTPSGGLAASKTYKVKLKFGD